jgi:alanyl-tRNA synthetase
MLLCQHLEKESSSDLDPKFAFELLATYGFPVDLTAIAAAHRGLVRGTKCWLLCA